eukprot:TRINITY_DN59835_c0_g1_i1.p1 TRINITY_DN59835_c0_g1~~TRINITY_DN59835_c0_g1_i1.p1  ORF type:complete len:305 (-),score=51.41 TRINITY_DN59835_c0_g1_i1:256-1170(-)
MCIRDRSTQSTGEVECCIMGYGSNGFNSNGSCMNQNNQISQRSSIRLYPGVSSGGSFASFCGGGADERARAATKIMKQVQSQPLKERGNVRPAPGSQLKQPLTKTVVINNKIQPPPAPSDEPFETENRVLSDTHASKTGEVETGVAIGNRVVQASSTSLSLGSESDRGQRNGRRRGCQQVRNEDEVPSWMSSRTSHRAIDCTPAAVQHGVGVNTMSRAEFEQMYDAEKALDEPFGTGNRGLADRQRASKPVGSDIGHLDRVAGKRSTSGGAFSLGNNQDQMDVSKEDKNRMRIEAEARRKCRPF